MESESEDSLLGDSQEPEEKKSAIKKSSCDNKNYKAEATQTKIAESKNQKPPILSSQSSSQLTQKRNFAQFKQNVEDTEKSQNQTTKKQKKEPSIAYKSTYFRNKNAQFLKSLITKQSHPRTKISLRTKDFYQSGGVNFLVNRICNLPIFKHKNDGLIITKINYPYLPGKSSGILKWKPDELNSVDFIVTPSKIDISDKISNGNGLKMRTTFNSKTKNLNDNQQRINSPKINSNNLNPNSQESENDDKDLPQKSKLRKEKSGKLYELYVSYYQKLILFDFCFIEDMTLVKKLDSMMRDLEIHYQRRGQEDSFISFFGAYLEMVYDKTLKQPFFGKNYIYIYLKYFFRKSK